MKPKKLVKRKEQMQSKDPSDAEVINRAILVGSGLVAILVNYFIHNKTITRPIDLIALLVATYAFVQLNKSRSFKHILVTFLWALLIVIGIFIIGGIIFFMIMLS